jgi:hypothetical protein
MNTAIATDATTLFRSAYENRYTWDQAFPGYSADVTYQEGDRVVTGQVKVGADLKAEVSGVEDEAAAKAIQQQLWEIAIHRVRRPFEQTHAGNTFSLGSTDETGAVEILVGGKAVGDRYKIRHNEVVLVHRHIHGVVVTINTLSTYDTGEGYLSHTYDSVYHDPQTGQQTAPKSQFEDTYEQVGTYHILNRRWMQSQDQGQPTTTVFTLSNIRLLPHN